MTEADTEFPRRGVDTDPREIRRDGRDARSTTERNGRARTARSRFSRARAAATRETFALRSCAADAAGRNGAQLVAIRLLPRIHACDPERARATRSRFFTGRQLDESRVPG